MLLLVLVSCKSEPKVDKEAIERAKAIQDSIEKSKLVVVEEPEKKKKVVKKKKKKKISKETIEVKQKVISLPAGTPNFKNIDARRYVLDYEAYVSQYRKAVEASDMDSFLKLSKASSSLNSQYKTLISKLSGEEVDMILSYMDKKTKQINELTNRMYQ